MVCAATNLTVHTNSHKRSIFPPFNLKTVRKHDKNLLLTGITSSTFFVFTNPPTSYLGPSQRKDSSESVVAMVTPVTDEKVDDRYSTIQLSHSKHTNTHMHAHTNDWDNGTVLILHLHTPPQWIWFKTIKMWPNKNIALCRNYSHFIQRASIFQGLISIWTNCHNYNINIWIRILYSLGLHEVLSPWPL